MKAYFDAVIPMIEGFFSESYTSMPKPSHYYFISEGQTNRSACGGEDEDTYAYCSGDNNVYLGQKMAWDLYSQAGDLAPAAGLAHEWGHNVQEHVGLPLGTISEPAQQRAVEQQADCIAGAWLRWEGQQGDLETEDAATMSRFIPMIADDPNNPSADHGDTSARTDAFTIGIEGGLRGCNNFEPSFPIITGS